MFSKVSTRVNQLTNLTGVTARSFRATVAANNTKKPSIGDAVTILQSKVSGINQVVSKLIIKVAYLKEWVVYKKDRAVNLQSSDSKSLRYAT